GGLPRAGTALPAAPDGYRSPARAWPGSRAEPRGHSAPARTIAEPPVALTARPPFVPPAADSAAPCPTPRRRGSGYRERRSASRDRRHGALRALRRSDDGAACA